MSPRTCSSDCPADHPCPDLVEIVTRGNSFEQVLEFVPVLAVRIECCGECIPFMIICIRERGGQLHFGLDADILFRAYTRSLRTPAGSSPP